MDPRVRWQTLQAHVSAARFALKMGDLERARQEVETALSIDPDFLAARLLRDQLKTPETSTIPPAPEVFQVPAAPRPAAPTIAASAAKLAQIEEKVKERIASRAALHEVRASSPVSRAPRPSARQWRAGAVAAAGMAFAAALASNARVHEPLFLYSHATMTTASLVDVASPLAVDLPPASDGPAAIERPVAIAPQAVVPPPVVAQPVAQPVRVAVTAPLLPATVQQTIATPLPVQAAPVSSVVTDSPPPAIVPRVVDERALVEEALARYRRAYNRLDAQSAKEVYPAVNAPALSRAFDGLQSQSLQFDECDIDVRGVLASVTCRGTSRYVAKVGNRDPQVEPRVWDFTLRKDEGDWKIENARAGR